MNLSTSSILATLPLPAATHVWKKDGATLKNISLLVWKLFDQTDSPDSECLGSHVGLIHYRVGGDHSKCSKQQNQEMLTVHWERGHQSVHHLHLLHALVLLDDVEDLRLVLWTKNASRNLAEELLHDTGDGVEGVVLDVDESPLLQEVNQLLHAGLVTRGSEHLLLEWSLLVQLEQHHQQWSREVRSTHLQSSLINF